MLNLELWHVVLSAVVLVFLGGVVGGWIAILSNVVKASREARQGVSTLLEEAADQMAHSSPQDWAASGLHLLKALDVRVEGQEYQATLRAIRSSIDTRLATGQWPGKDTGS
jgi:hypothetical protein